MTETESAKTSEQSCDQVPQQGDHLKNRSYSFSNMMGCNANGEKKQLTRPRSRAVFIELLEDCDRWSLFSDSGVSDISHTTDNSINSVVDTRTINSPPLGMRKNYSTTDIPSVKQHSVSPQSQQKLPNYMLWKWLSHQKYGVTDNTHQTPVTSENQQPGDNSNSIVAQVKSKYSFKMRDLNALVPNEW